MRTLASFLRTILVAILFSLFVKAVNNTPPPAPTPKRRRPVGRRLRQKRRSGIGPRK